MRLASYNVENLFDRARVMNESTWEEGSQILGDFASLNKLLGKKKYTASDKTKMVDLLVALGLERSDSNKYVILRSNRGKLLSRPRTGGVTIVASGRADWAGSLELVEVPVNEVAMQNTARVIRDVNADVLGVVEAESRPSLSAFNDVVVSAVGGTPYEHVMLVDGNDARGIDVGIMTRGAYPIMNVSSHVDDEDAKGKKIFSRDCPEYLIQLPSGETLLVLLSHLKSKGYGSSASSNARRREQAQRTADIYRAARKAGRNLVAVLGDMNDTPDSGPLKPLVQDTNLKDAFRHPKFDKGGYEGTYGSCGPKNKIDFLLLSPALYSKIQEGGVFRTGMWPGSRPLRWKAFAEVTNPAQAASDHAAVWVNLNV